MLTRKLYLLASIGLMGCASSEPAPIIEVTMVQRDYVNEKSVDRDATSTFQPNAIAGAAIAGEGYRHVIAFRRSTLAPEKTETPLVADTDSPATESNAAEDSEDASDSTEHNIDAIDTHQDSDEASASTNQDAPCGEASLRDESMYSDG
ncbi:hypothetical protein [uncultured Umboniibacter sp.]|uniref:hypothetical protein n=1 Tax=uncultured Umboniibacter sp. TaxID=1798917 RepID=UPI0026332FA1|nr:hypothetical protein [uncultured Umboniibacter sp.]